MKKIAFSFIELLVVLSIMGLALGISAGYFTRFRSGTALRLAAQAMVAACHQARSLAIAEQTPHGVALDPARGTVVVYRRDDALTRTVVSEPYSLPAGVVIDSTNFAPDTILAIPAIGFGTTGTATSGSIWLRNSHGVLHTVTVISPTGRARIYNYYKAS